MSRKTELGGQFVFARQRAQFVPGRVFDLDAGYFTLLLPEIFDLARIEHAGRALRWRRRLEIARELGDLFLEILQRTERGDVEHRHEAAVIVPAGRLDAETQACEQPAEHLDHRGEAASLVALGAAERQQRAAFAELPGIGGLASFAVDDPAGRNFLAARGGELDLSSRYRRGRHVQIERRVEIRWHRDRDGIGAEPRFAAAERRDMLGRTAGIGGGDADHALAHCHHGIGGEPSDMALAEHRACGDIGGLGLLDRQRHRLGVDIETKAPMAVDDGRGRGFLHDRPLRAGYDMPDLDAVDIGRDRDHPVRVMAREVGVDAANRNGVGFLVRRAGRPKQRRADAREAVSLHQRHGISSAQRPRSKRVLLVVGGMVSKRQPKSKWQTIEIAAAKRGRRMAVPLGGIFGIRVSRMARKIAGPGRRGLLGNALEQNRRAVGERSADGQFQTRAPVGRHRLRPAAHLKRGSPPPCRGRRPLLLRDRAPPREFAHGAFKLHISGRMHRSPPQSPITAGRAASAK